MGYRLLDGLTRADVAFRAEEDSLENGYMKVSFSANGPIAVLDKENNKELLSGGKSGCKAVIIDDPSDTWSHDIKTYSNEIGYFGNATIKVLENGPLRATIRVTTTYHDSKLTIDWTL